MRFKPMLFAILAAGATVCWGGRPLASVPTNAPVAFFGDSITAGLRGSEVWKRHFAEGPYRAVSYGVGGYTTDTTFEVIDAVRKAGVTYRVAVLMIGINDINGRASMKEPALVTVFQITHLIDRLREAFPGVKVVWCPITPRSATVCDPRRMRGDVVNEAVKAYLHRSQKHYPDVTVCDFGAQLVDAEGTLHREMARDLLHFGDKGREAWFAALKPHLDYALGLSDKKPGIAKPAPSAIGRGLKRLTNGSCDVVFENRPRFEAKFRRVQGKYACFDIVLMGDSITQRFETGNGSNEWNAVGKKVRALNLGIDGARVQTLLWNLKYASFLENIEARYISLLIGTNNFGDAPEDIAEGIAACIAEIRRKRPESKILLMPILPRTRPIHAAMRAQSNRVNELIRPFADGKNVIWFDLRPVFEGKDVTSEKQAELLPDGVHPNAEGYVRWREALLKIVQE